MKIQRDYEPTSTTLLIHLGGLGDLCLSESTIYSLNLSLESLPVALGYRRFLRLFDPLFFRIESIDARPWLSLFSVNPPETLWKRIIFIGKDRRMALRDRWQNHSIDPLIFIDMYPDESNTVAPAVHVEDYQLGQLAYYCINGVKKSVPRRKGRRIVLYIEKGFEKKKWPVGNFIHLYAILKDKGIGVTLLAQREVAPDIPGSLCIDDLSDVQTFFSEGGVIVSNDSGIAHLAGISGLATVTIFGQFDPAVWHPRGPSVTLRMDGSFPPPDFVASIASDLVNGDGTEGRPLFRCSSTSLNDRIGLWLS